MQKGNMQIIPEIGINSLSGVAWTMTNFFEIINRIRRNQFAFMIGGICLTGLCLGPRLVSGALEQRENDLTVQDRQAGFDSVLCEETTPLYGQGVVFYDQANQEVCKVDSFAFDPSNPVAFANPFELATSEPKRLRYQMPASVSQADETSNVGTNGTIIPISYPSGESAAEPYPTQFATTEYDATPGNQQTMTQQYDIAYHIPVADDVAERHLPADDDMRIAMRFSENRNDTYFTDTGDHYVTWLQLDEILHSRESSRQSDGIRKGPFTITPYGYINVATSYETNRTVMGDFALYSRSPDLDGGGHSGFHIDPKSSRLGMKINGPDLEWCCRPVKTSAVFEIDFQGANYAGPRNRGAVMQRRAFVDFTQEDTRLLIGQEWDVVSPLVPQSLNYVPGSYVGNVGYRRAQIRLERTRKWDSDFSTIWQIALCDNVPTDYLTDGVNIANSGWPMFQGRFATSFGHNIHADCRPYTVGISGHVGELTHDYSYYSNLRRRHETWSVNLDVEVPLTTRFQLTGELYTGANLSPLLAGIGQGVDLLSPRANGGYNFDPHSAKASGGWINLNFKMTKKFQMNAGYSIERMKDIIASSFNATARDKNQMLFLNGIYNWSDNFLTGLEVSQWRTDWHVFESGRIRELAPGKTTRIEFLTRYSF